jgi:ABC-type nitrate/sulfonate/bicarbonate transport system ATPase subunit
MSILSITGVSKTFPGAQGGTLALQATELFPWLTVLQNVSFGLARKVWQWPNSGQSRCSSLARSA